MPEVAEARTRGIKRVLWQILVLNVAVSIAKASWGLVSGSTAMFADGIHSLTDASSNVVALVAMSAASKPMDESHPYGHQKYESFASAIIGVMLLLAAWRVGSESVTTLVAYARSGVLPEVEVTTTSFVIMLVTLTINIFVVWFESRRGKELDSDVLQSDAKHTLSDIWVTLGVILSLVLVRIGVPIADPVVGLFVAIAIVFAAIEVFKGVNTTFSDKARLNPYEVRERVVGIAGVKGAHNIRTRGTGAFVHMDMSILVDPSISVSVGHGIAQQVEAQLCSQYPGLKDVVVHVEPDTEEQRARPFLSSKYE
jgi:cation diffusion facilitator family transporter